MWVTVRRQQQNRPYKAYAGLLTAAPFAYIYIAHKTDLLIEASQLTSFIFYGLKGDRITIRRTTRKTNTQRWLLRGVPRGFKMFAFGKKSSKFTVTYPTHPYRCPFPKGFVDVYKVFSGCVHCGT